MDLLRWALLLRCSLSLRLINKIFDPRYDLKLPACSPIPTAEETGLEPVQSEFESLGEYFNNRSQHEGEVITIYLGAGTIILLIILLIILF